MVVTEFRGGFLPGVHSGNASTTRVMGCPFGDVVDLSRYDDPAVVSGVVQGDFLACDGTRRLDWGRWLPEIAGDRGVVSFGGAAEVPRS